MFPLGGLTLPAHLATTISFGNQSPNHIVVSPTDAEASVYFYNTGSGANIDNNTVNFDWMHPPDPSTILAANYDIRASGFSGDALAAGTLNTWMNLGTSRSWILQDTRDGNFNKSCSFTIEIRDAATLVVLDSATMTLSTSVNI